jgi:hypothetical protein
VTDYLREAEPEDELFVTFFVERDFQDTIG